MKPTPSNARSRLIAILAAVALALLYAEFTRHAVKYAYPPTDQTKGDFLAFYEAAQAMRTGGDLYVERHRNYIYPPLVAFLYLPLTIFSDPPTLHRTAGIIALLTNVAMSFASVWLFARESLRRLTVGAPAPPAPMPPVRPCLAGDRCDLATSSDAQSPAIRYLIPPVALLATLIIADKTRSELRMWQTNALMLFFIACALRFLDRRPTLAGTFLGLAVNIKYLPIAFLPWLLLRRRFKTAGGMILGIVAGAFVPALWVGWSKNLEYLHAGFSGLLGLFGIAPPSSSPHAVMDDIAGGLSVSITSAIARAFGGPDHAAAALACSAVIAAAIAAAAAFLYHKRGLPILAWPSAAAQSSGPFPALVLLEAAAIIIVLLAFGPQTNPRHLSLLLLPAAAASALFFTGSGLPPRLFFRSRLPIILGIIALMAAISLPPGGTEKLDSAVRAWRNIAGPSYGLLAILAALVWTITRFQSSPASTPALEQPTSEPA